MADTTPADVLLLQPASPERDRLRQVLEGASLQVVYASDYPGARDAIADHRPKVVLCDSSVPGSLADELCAWLHQEPAAASTYLIVLAAPPDGRSPQELLELGADDLLSSDVGESELLARIRAGIRIWTMHDRLRRAAITDGLTGLYNHDHFNRLLEAEMNRSRRFGQPVALVMVDLDFFKAINDTFGHVVGNITLEHVARSMRGCVRDIDSLARFGGEEFAVIVPQATGRDAATVAERIRTALSDLKIPELRDHQVTASFGLADSDDPRVSSAADLLNVADRALYVAKRRGRNQVVSAVEISDTAELAVQIEADEVERLRRQVATLSVKARDVYVQSVAALLQALDEKDPFTARHAANVAFFAREIAEQMGCSKSLCRAVHNAGLLHDIGKVGVPTRILLKRTPLTSLERMVLEQVPIIGTRIVDHLRILETEVQIIRHQREYFDGSGFPGGLAGTQIPVGSRILLVADAFDAMTTDRVYRSRKPIPEALREIQSLAGTQFDPRAVTALRQVLDRDLPKWEELIQETITALVLPRPSVPIESPDPASATR